ncbi:MAG: GerMN domain-containing protein [Negativicutes bacterium]|nr:GerMN domain-containing protein [Negativicutes bacterium]
MADQMKKILLVALLALTTLAAGCSPTTPSTAPPGTEADKEQAASLAPGTADTMRLTVYYATADAMYLAPEVRVVPKTPHPAQSALELLLQDPKGHGLVKVLPEGTKVRGITIKDHVAFVDFNDKLIKNNGGGSASEILTVGAIVNTLTEFPEIHKVQIMVEGKKVDTLSGHMDTSEPLSRSEQIVRKSL